MWIYFFGEAGGWFLMVQGARQGGFRLSLFRLAIFVNGQTWQTGQHASNSQAGRTTLQQLYDRRSSKQRGGMQTMKTITPQHVETESIYDTVNL